MVHVEEIIYFAEIGVRECAFGDAAEHAVDAASNRTCRKDKIGYFARRKAISDKHDPFAC